jgi:hypothetical protein
MDTLLKHEWQSVWLRPGPLLWLLLWLLESAQRSITIRRLRGLSYFFVVSREIGLEVQLY